MTDDDLNEKIERIGAIVARNADAALAVPPPIFPEYLTGADIDARSVRLHAAWDAAIPVLYRDATLEGFDREASLLLLEWSEQPRGRNLILFGAVGTGKSHAACAACRNAFYRSLDVAFVPVVEMLNDLRPGGQEGYLRDLMHVDRLILDDLGLERPTEWTAEQMFAIVNRRYLEQRPTVATTNLAPAALEEAIGERLFSRLAGNAISIEMLGPDRRVS